MSYTVTQVSGKHAAGVQLLRVDVTDSDCIRQKRKASLLISVEDVCKDMRGFKFCYIVLRNNYRTV